MSEENFFKQCILRYPDPAYHPLRVRAHRIYQAGLAGMQVMPTAETKQTYMDGWLSANRAGVKEQLEEAAREYALEAVGKMYAEERFKTIQRVDIPWLMGIYDAVIEAERLRAQQAQSAPPSPRPKQKAKKQEWTEELDDE